MAIFLCTDNTFVAVHKPLLQSEAVVENWFECRDRQFLPSGFKGVNVIREGYGIVLSQPAYLDTKGKAHRNDKTSTPLHLYRELMDKMA